MFSSAAIFCLLGPMFSASRYDVVETYLTDFLVRVQDNLNSFEWDSTKAKSCIKDQEELCNHKILKFTTLPGARIHETVNQEFLDPMCSHLDQMMSYYKAKAPSNYKTKDKEFLTQDLIPFWFDQIRCFQCIFPNIRSSFHVHCS